MVWVGARTLSLVHRAKFSSWVSGPGCPTVLLGQDPPVRCFLTGRNESLAPRNEDTSWGHVLGATPQPLVLLGAPS